MPIDDILGRIVERPVRRLGAPGAFLEIDPGDDRLLLVPRLEVPAGVGEGDVLSVFVYLDSEDRPIATTRAPMITLGEVAFLEVTDVSRVGAFVDWGLMKELFVPFAEHTFEPKKGDRVPIGLYVDSSGRLAGTMRVSEMLRDKGDFTLDEWVEGEVWRVDPEIGAFVIVERAFAGLVPASEPHGLSRGARATFRVSNVLRDGRIELSLRGHAHEEIDCDAARVLDVLKRGPVAIGDRSSPEEIRAAFGLSKKAFKKAAGRLLRERAITVDARGFFVVAR